MNAIRRTKGVETVVRQRTLSAGGEEKVERGKAG